MQILILIRQQIWCSAAKSIIVIIIHLRPIQILLQNVILMKKKIAIIQTKKIKHMTIAAKTILITIISLISGAIMQCVSLFNKLMQQSLNSGFAEV